MAEASKIGQIRPLCHTNSSIQEVEQQEDRLSALPDDILLSVLDRVGLRGAARSGVLSRRWRHLPDAIPTITLDVKRRDGFFELKADGVRSTRSEMKAETNMALAAAARSLLARRGQEQGLRFLYLRFYLRDESVGIVRAVDDAMARGCGVARATFVMVAEKMDYRCTGADLATHAGRFLSCLDACPRAFAALTKLHVESVKLLQPDIDNVLAACTRCVFKMELNIPYATELEDDVDLASQEETNEEEIVLANDLSDWDNHVKLKKSKKPQ